MDRFQNLFASFKLKISSKNESNKPLNNQKIVTLAKEGNPRAESFKDLEF